MYLYLIYTFCALWNSFCMILLLSPLVQAVHQNGEPSSIHPSERQSMGSCVPHSSFITSVRCSIHQVSHDLQSVARHNSQHHRVKATSQRVPGNSCLRWGFHAIDVVCHRIVQILCCAEQAVTRERSPKNPSPPMPRRIFRVRRSQRSGIFPNFYTVSLSCFSSIFPVCLPKFSISQYCLWLKRFLRHVLFWLIPLTKLSCILKKILENRRMGQKQEYSSTPSVRKLSQQEGTIVFSFYAKFLRRSWYNIRTRHNLTILSMYNIVYLLCALWPQNTRFSLKNFFRHELTTGNQP